MEFVSGGTPTLDALLAAGFTKVDEDGEPVKVKGKRADD